MHVDVGDCHPNEEGSVWKNGSPARHRRALQQAEEEEEEEEEAGENGGSQEIESNGCTLTVPALPPPSHSWGGWGQRAAVTPIQSQSLPGPKALLLGASLT